MHRIGQTRPVTGEFRVSSQTLTRLKGRDIVKTLAIRGTFEEYMVQRRRDLKGSGSKPPGLAEEWGIRNYLQVRGIQLPYIFAVT